MKEEFDFFIWYKEPLITKSHTDGDLRTNKNNETVRKKRWFWQYSSLNDLIVNRVNCIHFGMKIIFRSWLQQNLKISYIKKKITVFKLNESSFFPDFLNDYKERCPMPSQIYEEVKGTYILIESISIWF